MKNDLLDFGLRPYLEKLDGSNFIDQELSYYVGLKVSKKHLAELNPKDRTPIQLVIVLDVSRSMDSSINGKVSRMEKACTGIFQVLTQLKPRDALWIITFSNECKLFNFNENGNIAKGSVISFLNNLPRSGGTSFYQPIKLAASVLKSTRTQGVNQVVCFLTDGELNSSKYSKEAVLDLHEEVLSLGATWIFGGVGVSDQGEQFLKQLGGRYFVSIDEVGLEQFFLFGIIYLAFSVVQNLRIRFEPSQTIPQVSIKIRHLELVMNNFDELAYNRSKGGELYVGSLIRKDFFRCYLELQVRFSVFHQGLLEIGKLILTADKSSDSSKIQLELPVTINIGNQTKEDSLDLLQVLKKSAEFSRELYWFAVGRYKGDPLKKIAKLIETMPDHQFSKVLQNILKIILQKEKNHDDQTRASRSSLCTMTQNIEKTISGWQNPTNHTSEGGEK